LYLVIGNLSMGFLFAYIFAKANVGTMGSGFITGGIVGLLMSVGYDCMMYATTNIISKKAMAADVVAMTVMCAIVGAVVAMVMGMGRKTP
ncbi:MAG TPA: hypothetical protein VHL77_10850, partial [Ferruginibacter sp.]|nr:hypothetical protein [Ferruginibacter sp.]